METFYIQLYIWHGSSLKLIIYDIGTSLEEFLKYLKEEFKILHQTVKLLEKRTKAERINCSYTRKMVYLHSVF